MSDVSRHMAKYSKPRIETLQAIARREAMTAELKRDVAREARQRRINAIKRVLRWPASVWRW